MPDPFFAKLAESGWRVPAKQRIAYLVVGRDVVPGGGVRIKIRGHPSGPNAVEWQLRLHPLAFRCRGQKPIDSRYADAKTLDDALAAAMAEAERIVERFRAAHVQRSPMPGPGAVATPARPPAEPGQKVRNAYRLGKRTATVVLDIDLHERLITAALDTGRTMQALLVEGAEMVLARSQERHPRKAG
jgi:hypothetical protein